MKIYKWKTFDDQDQFTDWQLEKQRAIHEVRPIVMSNRCIRLLVLYTETHRLTKVASIERTSDTVLVALATRLGGQVSLTRSEYEEALMKKLRVDNSSGELTLQVVPK